MPNFWGPKKDKKVINSPTKCLISVKIAIMTPHIIPLPLVNVWLIFDLQKYVNWLSVFSKVNPCFQKAQVFCMDLQPATDPYNVVCNTKGCECAKKIQLYSDCCSKVVEYFLLECFMRYSVDKWFWQSVPLTYCSGKGTILVAVFLCPWALECFAVIVTSWTGDWREKLLHWYGNLVRCNFIQES